MPWKYGCVMVIYESLPLIFALSFMYIAWTWLIILFEPWIRKSVTASPFWKLQFMLHPLLIGGLVGLSAWHPSRTWIILVSLFAFNFAVVPWDIPKDILFLIFFYMHHIAPLLACIFVIESNDTSNSYPIAQFLVYAIIWSLHSLESFEHRKWIKSKNDFFWPYMVLSFSFHLFWHLSIKNSIKETGKMSYWVQIFVALIPIFIQYIGRWFLWMRMWHLAKPKDKNKPHWFEHDTFNRNKQFYEFMIVIITPIIVHCI